MPDAASTWSLQDRVRLISVFAVVAAVLFGSAATYLAIPHENNQATENRLEQHALKIAQSAQRHLDKKLSGSPEVYTIPSELLAEVAPGKYQIWLPDGVLLTQSPNSVDSAPIMPLGFSGYSRIKYLGEYRDVYSTTSSNGSVIVQIAMPSAGQMPPIGASAAKYFAFAGLSIGVLLLAIHWLLKNTFKPLDQLANSLSTRGQADLSSPTLEDPPAEVLPLLQLFDSAVSRLNHAAMAENRFTAVAAHELRTPLAGIRAQAQIASKARDQEELQEALDSVLIGVDKAKRVVNQLIDLAKVESTGNEIAWSTLPLKLSSVFAEVMEELSPMVHARKVKLNAAFDSDQIHGIDFAIYMLLRNLLANALLYCPVGGTVEVRAQRQGDDVSLTVDDSGPGIPPQARATAFEKFNRLGKSGPEGVGLGLSIVAQVAKLHKANIELLTSPLGGLRAQVVFRRLH